MMEVLIDCVFCFVILLLEKMCCYKIIVMFDDIIVYFICDVFSSFFSFDDI